MTGPHDSIIGVQVEPALRRFINGMPARFGTASGKPRLNGVIIEVDAATGLADGIERVSLSSEDVDALTGAPASAS